MLHSVEAIHLTDNTKVAYVIRTGQRSCNVVHFTLAVGDIILTVFVPEKEKKKKRVNPLLPLAQNIHKI
jgi:hypothetical protein